MFGNGTTRSNSGMIVAKIRFDGQLPATQPVLRTGDDRRITVGSLGAPVGRGIFWPLFKVFGHAIHRVPRDGDKGRGRRKPVEVQSDVRNRRNYRDGAEVSRNWS